MHILYVHQNFPAQFGHIASHLAQRPGWTCTYVSQVAPGVVQGVRMIQYKPGSGATQANHYCSRTFENQVWHCDGVYQTLKAHPEVKPDLIVGHSGFGSTLFLRELYPHTPVVNLFEYYYLPHAPDSDVDFRRDLNWPTTDMTYQRARCRNAMLLLDLQNCEAGYTPTEFQKSRFPREYQDKLEVIFDGIDRQVYHGHNEELRPPMGKRQMRWVGQAPLPPHVRLVTYVSRGFESMRGFDTFMRAAQRIAERFPDVLFAVIGDDKIAYGGDADHIKPHTTFKQWVLAQQKFDLSRFAFLGRLDPLDLARLLAASDLHIYLTAPFVLSWSLMDAMSCGAVVLGSATPPVMEMIRDGETGLLADFFDIEQIADKALAVLKDPDAYRPLGRAAERMIAEKFSMDAVLPRMVEMYERVGHGG